MKVDKDATPAAQAAAKASAEAIATAPRAPGAAPAPSARLDTADTGLTRRYRAAGGGPGP